MPRYKERRQGRFNHLLGAGFLRFEATELSQIPGIDTALRQMVKDRVARWQRFVQIAHHKVDNGVWDKSEVTDKWKMNLQRMYRKRNWNVQFGGIGRQRKLPKGSPNPWAMYRSYLRVSPWKAWVSPWEVRSTPHKKLTLQRDLIRIQKTERSGGAANKNMIRQWMNSKLQAIAQAKGDRKQSLIAEYNRLAAMA